MSGSTNEPCETVRLSLGAYALGTLEPGDQHDVESHLASCPACLVELAELDAVVPSLATLSVDDVHAPTPSPDLLGRIASAVETPAATRVDGSRSRRLLLALAAVVVLLAGAGVVTRIATSSPSGTTNASGTSGAVGLRVAATDAASGTRLELTASGLPRREHCRLVAVAADGSRHDAGSWEASYEGHAEVTEATDVARSELRRLILYGSNGTRLVTVRL